MWWFFCKCWIVITSGGAHSYNAGHMYGSGVSFTTMNMYVFNWHHLQTLAITSGALSRWTASDSLSICIRVCRTEMASYNYDWRRSFFAKRSRGCRTKMELQSRASKTLQAMAINVLTVLHYVCSSSESLQRPLDVSFAQTDCGVVMFVQHLRRCQVWKEN